MIFSKSLSRVSLLVYSIDCYDKPSLEVSPLNKNCVGVEDCLGKDRMSRLTIKGNAKGALNNTWL